MSYYILPKINIKIKLEPEFQNYATKPYISHTLLHHYNDIQNVIDKLSESTANKEINYEEMFQMVNPYEYIFSSVPGPKNSVSKLNVESNVFYDFMEIANTLNIFDHFKGTMNCIHISEYDSTMDYMNMVREDKNDKHVFFHNIKELHNNVTIENNSIDFMYFENIQNKNSTYDLLLFFINQIRLQSNCGVCVIKVNQMFYKPIIDLLYLLSSLYEKVCIIKPSTSNVTSFERYIVCKNFHYQFDKIEGYYSNLFLFLSFLSETESEKSDKSKIYISHLLKEDLPYYFINKVEESNIIIGQQQLEAMDLIVSIYKNRNSEDKIETLKKMNIQKCVYWCEKYKIPYNKFAEKINIFLPLTKSEEFTFLSDLCDEETSSEKYLSL